ncbi:MAG: acylphosphatase [Pseudomonadota bacterium]
MATVLSPNKSKRLAIRGELQSASFLPWVERHCRRLGLICEIVYADAGEAVFKVDGQTDLIDALEVGCLLGPIDVWVETITISQVPPNF